nr:Dihydrofolate reductase [uncultured bacterium]
MKVSMIVAMSENRVIGKENQLPWRLPEDLKRFKEITIGHPVIMGRKTFESIGRLLPGRENIVITRQTEFSFPGAVVKSSLEAALSYCERKAEESFIIGGAEIYRLGMPYATRIYLTLIRKSIEGDAYFPTLPSGFEETQRDDRNGDLPFSFLVLERKL